MNFKDLTGQKFGKLTVLNRAQSKIDKSGKARTMWNCKCDCGNNIAVLADYLRRSECPSCGCYATKRRIEKNRIDNVGEKFGRLTILDAIWDAKPTKAICKCDCGNDYVGIKADIVSGHTQSCGCLQSENTSIANTKNWSGYIADCGVEFIKQDHMNKKGQWIWECKCGFCSNTFYELPARINSGHTTSCGCLTQSFGENYIKLLLQEMNVSFVPQYTFDDCKYVYVLHFDFAIFYNNTLLGLIEYDGRQHFQPVDLFGGIEEFEKTKVRDNIKNTYCSVNNIPLLRIPYTLSTNEIKQSVCEYYLSLTTAATDMAT
jgi:hypothetical protein